MPSLTDVDDFSTNACEIVVLFAGMIFTVDFLASIFAKFADYLSNLSEEMALKIVTKTGVQKLGCS